MTAQITLASASSIRRELLENAGLTVAVMPARVDEDALKRSLLAEGAGPRDIADALAEMKAARVAAKNSDALVLGCDQVLALGRDIVSKPETPVELARQLDQLRGQTHQLLSAAVLYENGKPVWRHVGVARLTMHAISDGYRDAYIDRNWDAVRHCVGGYQLEAEGVRLFSRIEGDYFTVLGLPLLPLLSYLTLRGTLPG